MKRSDKWFLLGVLAAVLVFGLVGCARTSVAGLQLVGNYANPSAGVLSGLCTSQCNANACVDYNTIANACLSGLPIQGAIGSAVFKQMACPDLGYATSGTFVPMQIAAACFQPTPVSSSVPPAK